MQERGIDIRHHRSKSVSEFASESFDYVITVCDAAAEACPVFPGPAQRIHWSLPDPAAATGSEDERLAIFRRVRDALEANLREWMATLPPDTVHALRAKPNASARVRRDSLTPTDGARPPWDPRQRALG
jgi:hypothetical protein